MVGRYETAWGLTEEVPVREGVGQGCVAAPTRSKLMLGVMQRAVSRLCRGYKFTGASGGTPQMFYADDGAFVASNLYDLQLMFDTCYMVTRALGLNVTVKANGTKSAWSGTYWADGREHAFTKDDWEIKLPNGTVVPVVPEYKYLGGVERAVWRRIVVPDVIEWAAPEGEEF